MSVLSATTTPRIITSAMSTTAALALLTACTSADSSETSAPAPASPSSANITTVAEFDFTAGDAPENVLVKDNGSLIVSMLGAAAGQAPRLVTVTPAGEFSPVAQGIVGDTFLGIAQADETVFYNSSSTVADRTGVWAVKEGEMPQRLAALAEGSTPNGLGLSEDESTLYVADSVAGTVWSVPTGGGTATAWATGDALELDPAASVPLGANGLKVHDGAVWVSNISDGTMLRIPIGTDGSAGEIETVSTALDGIDDFSFISNDSDVLLAALNGPTEVVALCPNGDIEPVLDAADGLASPTATAVSAGVVFITNAGLIDNDKASLLQLTTPAQLCN